MIGSKPRRPTGNSPEALFMQWLWDNFDASRAQQAPGVVTSRTTRGIAYVPLARKGGVAAAVAGVKLMKIVGIQGADFVYCNPYLYPNWEATVVPVAKYPHMRMSVATEIVDGVPFNFSYQNDNNRTATDGATIEAEVVYPRYAVGSVFLAVRVSLNETGLPSAPEWIECGPRVWARRYLQ